MKVAIAGATGFIGRALAEQLKEKHEIVCLSRNKRISSDTKITWKKCDLFSLLECESALENVDIAFYLVHSMLPSARLTQGSFQDMDLIISDNFIRAAETRGVKQVVYLGGLVPDEPELSAHLKSRIEVEETLGSRSVPVTALRAGVIVGKEGSSFSMLVKLIERLKYIPCPPCAKSLTQPIALHDVLLLLEFCLNHPAPHNRFFDIGSPDIVSYKQFLRLTAETMGLTRHFYNFPFNSITIYKRVLAIITRTPLALVQPLLESMRHSMVAGSCKLQDMAGSVGMRLEDAIRHAIVEKEAKASTGKTWHPPRDKTVRSVQRICLPTGKSARWVAQKFSMWLPKSFRKFIYPEVDRSGNIRFMLGFPRILLLELTFSEDRSYGTERQLFYVTGGILARPSDQQTGRARLEFREALKSKVCLVAIHDYQPTLPWFLYNFTQAIVHLIVMRSFRKYINSQQTLEQRI